MNPPHVSILIVSFALDQPWLHQCLRSVNRYARGFAGVHVVYPDRDDSVMRPTVEHFGGVAHPYSEPLPPLGHLSQNAAKCRADVWTGNPPERLAHLGIHSHVTHLDSDCILTGDLFPEMLLDGERSRLIRRRWADADAAQKWKEPTDRALGWSTEWETMAGVPLTFHVKTYAAMRHYMRQLHGRPFQDYVLAQKPTWPSGFCEFNALGNFASKFHPELYHWVTIPNEPPPRYPIRQLWSHCGVTEDYQRWIDEVLEHGERRPPPSAGPMRAESRKLLGL